MAKSAQTLSTTASDPDAFADRRDSRPLSINLAESPLAWLHARGKISVAQLTAGEQLRADYERAGLAARVTMRWDAPPPARRGRAPHDSAHSTLASIDAKRRFDAALAAAGPGLADICWRVICAGEGLPLAERSLGWPSRSGRLVLTLALDRLADHYAQS